MECCSLKIALIQLNPVIGDFENNCARIILYAHQAADLGCELAVFPELAVSGYPPLDLLERASFIEDHQAAVDAMILGLPPISVMFGCFERCAEASGKPLHNSVFVARNREIGHKTRKQLLPEYDVFDENRYFEPGKPGELFSCGGLTIGVTVCEDIWHYAVDDYRSRPVAELRELAARDGRSLDVLINVSASPFHRGKTQMRQSIFSSLIGQYQVPFLYVNQVGGQDSLLFDGASRALDGTGKTIARAAHFKEDMVVVDTDDWSGEIRNPNQFEEVELVHDALVMGVHDYVTKCGFSKAVLGLSGGIDSALTAALAAKALGPENVLGIALPSPYSSKESLEDAEALARGCGCRFKVLPLSLIHI